MSWDGLHQVKFAHSRSLTILSHIQKTEHLVYLLDGISQPDICHCCFFRFNLYVMIGLWTRYVYTSLHTHSHTHSHTSTFDQQVPLVKTFSDSRNVGSVVLVIFLMLSIAYAVWMIATSPMVTKFYENEKQKILIIPIATASLLIPFLPASNLLFWVGFVVAERVMYLPSIGSCVLFGTFIYLVYIRFAKFRFVGLLLGVCLIIASLRHTISRNNAWRDSETLYKEDMEVNPLNAKIPYGLARVYINRDRFDEAEKALIRSLHIEPRFGVALLWLGRVYVQQFQKTDTEKNVETFSKGLHLLRKACENSPDEFDAHIFLADTLIRSDSIAQTSLHEATRTALRASEIRPHSSRPFLCLARIRLRLGDIQGAMEFLRPVVRSAIGEDENLLYHRDASKESIYLYATLYAYLGDMDRATEYYSIAATHGHEIAMTILSALRNGEVNEIRQEALDALNLWSRKLGNAFFDATFKTRRETEIYKYTGPADLYEHVNVFVTPEGECVLSKPLLEYYNRMQDTILRNCRRRVLRGQIGAMTSAQIVYESITKESMLKGTSISLKAKQDFGYWMDHRISYDISIDDRPVTLKFGLTEDPIAIARVTCVLYVNVFESISLSSSLHYKILFLFFLN
jgi:tetratricopeptide (TPR) repeat protein